MDKKLTIAIDGSRLGVEQKTGVEVYSYNIIGEIIKDKQNNYLLWSKTDLPESFTQAPNIQVKKLKSAILWSQGRLAIELITHRSPDVIFVPSHVIPLVSKGKFVVTIHDLAFLHFPKIYTKSEIFYQKLAVKTAVKKARAIIVPSQFTKKDLVKNFPIKPDRVFVVPHGLDHNRFKPGRKDVANLPFDIRQPYILFTGRIESKKNIVNLVKAYGLLRQEAKVNHQLVLAGKPGLGWDEIEKEIDKLAPNIKNDIIETGYITDSTYLQLLQNADFFVFPSLYEGFGLPVLEAMATGVAVIASNSTSIKEVVGEAGMLVDSQKPLSIASGLSRLISHPKEKEVLIQKGLARVKNYSWSKAGQETLDILEEIGRSKWKF